MHAQSTGELCSFKMLCPVTGWDILFSQNFYREIEKEELYIRYIYKLADLHKRDQSFTEAGFTLLLRAEGLEVGHTV